MKGKVFQDFKDVQVGDKFECIKATPNPYYFQEGSIYTVTQDISDKLKLGEFLKTSSLFEKVIDDKPIKIGKRFNHDKPRVDLLVPEAMIEEAKVWSFGAKKYGDHNWRNNFPILSIIGCLLRHVFAIMLGEDKDEESGLLHSAHISCNASMLTYFAVKGKIIDDRYKETEDE